jgi:sporulation protein YlmC with PRC-barrel domain
MKDAISNKNPELMEGLKGYFGKRVVSKSGIYLGRVKEVLMSDYTVQGIVVGKLFIDKQYFASTIDKIMLTIDPVTLMLGKRVYDADGKKLGNVLSIVRSGANDFSEIQVRKNVIKKPVGVPKADISTTKTNIILNKVY